MLSLVLSFVVLLAGYCVYGKIIEKIFSPDDRDTPAVSLNDGVDYVPMKTGKAFLVQLLNIAGVGPIFGALMGACFGPIVFLWIIFGSVLGGAVHDYMIGMISERNAGKSIAELSGIYLGGAAKWVMRLFSVLLLLLTGVGAALIIMALGMLAGVLIGGYDIPEISLENMHPEGLSVWPYMFITVACGAISAFHATQSPMMAKCMTRESEGRKIFYGAMISESVVALVWAAVGVAFYGATGELDEALSELGQSGVVYQISTGVLGTAGGILAVIGDDQSVGSHNISGETCLKLVGESRDSNSGSFYVGSRYDVHFGSGGMSAYCGDSRVPNRYRIRRLLAGDIFLLP